jgi:hypothetical protein
VFFTSSCMEGTGSHSQLLWWGWWSLVVLVGMMIGLGFRFLGLGFRIRK